MKLSEAIRKGITKTGSCRGTYFREDEKGQIHACALGAALVGARPSVLRRQELPRYEEAGELILNIFPQKVTYKVAEPLHPQSVAESIIEQIITLNDSIGLSREEIADLLERNGY